MSSKERSTANFFAETFCDFFIESNDTKTIQHIKVYNIILYGIYIRKELTNYILITRRASMRPEAAL